MQMVRFANGDREIDRDAHYPVEAAEAIRNEDWKTAVAHAQRNILSGETGTMLGIVDNLYGRWARVKFDEVDFVIYTTIDRLKLLSEPAQAGC